jgi:hypothetical protein
MYYSTGMIQFCITKGRKKGAHRKRPSGENALQRQRLVERCDKIVDVFETN